MTPALPTRSPCRLRSELATLALALAATLAAPLSAGGVDPAGPDLKVEWVEGPVALVDVDPLSGAVGERLSVDLRIRNIGGDAAFAVVVEAYTAIGRHGRPRRVQPGPAAGQALDHSVELTLARGMRELCVAARLQRADVGDPDDPNPENNQVCRGIELHGRAGDEEDRGDDG